LIDSGASRSFIDYDEAKKFTSKLRKLEQPISLTLFDGNSTSAGRITHLLKATLIFEDGTSHQEDLLITKLHPAARIVLGLTWLQKYNPSINWTKLTFAFEGSAQLSAALIQNLDIHNSMKPPAPTIEEIIEPRLINKPTLGLDDPLLMREDEIVPEEYHQWKKVFSLAEAKTMPPHRPYDMTIDTINQELPPLGKLYNMSERELKELKDYIDDMLGKGFIRPSTSPIGAPVLFAKKK
ncbi:hypothetical protein K435DRAFT_587280, partial [Dendrothele bispora CBS 962.96]